MILSMTGFGEARAERGDERLRVEVRSVNNRYLKVVVRQPRDDAALDQAVEKLVRERIGRGTVNVAVHSSRTGTVARTEIDTEALARYWNQLRAWNSQLPNHPPAEWGAALLALPGAIQEVDPDDADDPETADRLRREFVLETVGEAVTNFARFRQTEGEAMRNDLEDQRRVLIERAGQIAERAPVVLTDYRDRLRERLDDLLNETDTRVNDADLIRETSLFADRCDINEELTRLRGHLDQFESFMDGEESQGRKLEFLGQEMYREVNTIGSKANDLEIAHAVVDMKAAIEKIREILQNVE